MTKRRIVLALVVCLFIGIFGVQTLSQTNRPTPLKPPDSKRLQSMSEQEKKKEIEKWRKEKELEQEQRREDSKKEHAERKRQFELESKQRKKDIAQETADKFWHEQFALGVTGKEWSVIRAKLEKVEILRSQARMPAIRVWGEQRLSGGKGPEYPDPQYLREWTWEWHRPSKEKRFAGLTEDERAIEDLIIAIESKNATETTFNRVTQALRDSRVKLEAQRKEKVKELSEAQQELRKILTTRQEAILVLMGWL